MFRFLVLGKSSILWTTCKAGNMVRLVVLSRRPGNNRVFLDAPMTYIRPQK